MIRDMAIDAAGVESNLIVAMPEGLLKGEGAKMESLR